MQTLTDNNRKWWILAAVGGLGGMILLDETVVGIALPTIRTDLGMSDVSAHWAISAYLLVFSVLTASAGRISDRIGLRASFVLGITIFGAASLASGLADSGTMLIIARIFQGVGSAIIFPLSVAAISNVFPPDQRGKALGMLATIGLVMFAAGPLLGGLLTELISWRWIFWINLPFLGLIAFLFLSAWNIPTAKAEKNDTRFDITGFGTLVLGLTLMVIAIMQASSWDLPVTLGLLTAGIVLLFVFAANEHRVAEPLIKTDLFGSPTFLGSNYVLLAGQFCKFSLVIFVPLYLQDVLHMNPFVAGLALLVAVGASPVAAGPAGHFSDKLGARRLTLISLSVATMAMIWIGICINWDSYIIMVPGLIVVGGSMPFFFVPPLRAIMSSVSEENRGQAGGISTTSRLLGGTIGVAICSMLYTLTQQFQVVFLVTAAVMASGLLVAWLCIERPTRANTDSPST
ncbi:MAG: MFS transporter [Stappiaceae bacterium]